MEVSLCWLCSALMYNYCSQEATKTNELAIQFYLFAQTCIRHTNTPAKECTQSTSSLGASGISLTSSLMTR
ncbi:unnamed protein product [Larinioides sclopetarius]|uniref:Secreted protein n=1 Tax=Larinioides sclopetarius TaxID=280406 RepID=A0AAV2AUX7_9ARAC